MGDKRKYPRFDVVAKIRFKKTTKDSFNEDGVAKNISAEGFCFSSKERFEKGDVIDVEIVERGLESSPLQVNAEVMWSYKSQGKDASGKEMYDTGLKVIGIRQTDEARFAMLYCERLLAEVKGYLRI